MVAYKIHPSEKNATNRVILSQIARSQHNRVNTPLLQKNIGKIMIFSVFKKFGISQDNHLAFENGAQFAR